MNAAWMHFNVSEFGAAISCAMELIDEFQPAALRLQHALSSAKQAEYPDDADSDPTLKTEIFANGPLNDVATAYLVAGRSFEKQRGYESARLLYGECADLTYARTWDPRGWFWRPSQVCTDRLLNLP